MTGEPLVDWCMFRCQGSRHPTALCVFLGTAAMSDFIDSEAEESEEEFEESDLKPKKTQRFLEEDGKMWKC